MLLSSIHSDEFEYKFELNYFVICWYLPDLLYRCSQVSLCSWGVYNFFHKQLKIWHKATHYLGWLIGHEGQGSIMSLLKKKNWAHEIYAGNSGQGHEENGYMSDFSMNLRKMSWNCDHKFNIIYRLGTSKCTLFRNSVLIEKLSYSVYFVSSLES